MEYFGFWVTQECASQRSKKLYAINNKMPTTSKKGVLALILIVKINHDIQSNCSHMLQPLTRLKSKNVKFKWTDVKQKSSDKV